MEAAQHAGDYQLKIISDQDQSKGEKINSWKSQRTEVEVSPGLGNRKAQKTWGRRVVILVGLKFRSDLQLMLKWTRKGFVDAQVIAA